jgi:hypothetical protein
MRMLPTNDKLSYVVGEPADFSARPLLPFDGKVRAFLALLSARLIADGATRTMPDVMSFAWWCRKSNIERLAKTYDDGALRIGRGLAFHVTPTNMPVNFAFSWAFSFLSGNANVVRLPNRDFPQIPFIVRHIDDLLKEGSFPEVRDMNAFVKYGREEEITEPISAIADVRIVWGGDETIRTIRKAPLPTRGVEICFADRYSFCILEAKEIINLDQADLERLGAHFFNDAYIMDQNACSSPRLVVWRGTDSAVEQAGDRFWSAVGNDVERRYELAAVSSVDKFAQACRDAIELDSVTGLDHRDNRVYRLRLKTIPADIDSRRCNNGYFYEYATNNLDDLAAIVTNKYQTLTYFGLPREELASFVQRNRLSGIDRIVPVGQAMNLGLIWDGYDLIRTLSRVCDVR